MVMNSTGSQSNLKFCLKEILGLEGALGVALGDWKTGMCLAHDGIDSPVFPNAALEIAIAGNTEVIRAKMKVAQMLKFQDKIDEILIVLTSQYHLMRVSPKIEGLFFYVALERNNSNLALARMKLNQVEKVMVI